MSEEKVLPDSLWLFIVANYRCDQGHSSVQPLAGQNAMMLYIRINVRWLGQASQQSPEGTGTRLQPEASHLPQPPAVWFRAQWPKQTWWQFVQKTQKWFSACEPCCKIFGDKIQQLKISGITEAPNKPRASTLFCDLTGVRGKASADNEKR